jgi:hypothetical protein
MTLGRTNRHRWVLAKALLFSLIMSAASLAWASSPVGAATVTMTAQQYNMCSASCGNHAAAANLVSYFNTTSPWSTSLNEFCQGDPVNLHYTGYFVVTKTQVPGCYGGSLYGIVISGPNPSATYSGYYNNQIGGVTTGCGPSNTFECRAMVCLKANVFGAVYSPCSTHLVNANTSVAQKQALEYTFDATAWSGGPRILQGDFNLTPNLLPSQITSGYKQAIYNYTYSTPSPSEFIDYIDPSYPTASGGTVLANYCAGSPSPSDHCYTFAQWTGTF